MLKIPLNNNKPNQLLDFVDLDFYCAFFVSINVQLARKAQPLHATHTSPHLTLTEIAHKGKGSRFV